MEEKVKYYGEWQEGSVILEKLSGPIGNGRVEFPNGDSFEGVFHLSFACISGPCYAACGKYTFADGSYIEHAWINKGQDKMILSDQYLEPNVIRPLMEQGEWIPIE